MEIAPIAGNDDAFMKWFRNGCTSNTMEEASALFQDYPADKQVALRDEYTANLHMIADFSRQQYIQD